MNLLPLCFLLPLPQNNNEQSTLQEVDPDIVAADESVVSRVVNIGLEISTSPLLSLTYCGFVHHFRSILN